MQGRGSHGPVPLILAPDVIPHIPLPLLPSRKPPLPSSNPSLPLGAGGESRSTLGTIRGLGGAGAVGPGGSRGGVGAGVGGKKVQGNSGRLSCCSGEGQRVGVKAHGAPHLPVPAVLPVTLGAGGERRTQAVAPGLAQAWLCTDSMLGAPSIVSQGPTPPFPIARTPSRFRVKDPGPPAEPALHPPPSNPAGSPCPRPYWVPISPAGPTHRLSAAA